MMDNHKDVLIIGFFPESHMPFMQQYENALTSVGISYDKLCFDRQNSGAPEHEGNSYLFKYEFGKGICTNNLRKILPYFRYRKYVKKLIKDNRYDKLIVLTTTPAILLGRLLTSKYFKRYIFDYRDITYCEKFWLYRKYVNRIVSKSHVSFVSSAGFLDYYIDRTDKVYVTHNISNFDSTTSRAVTMEAPINIGFIGSVRYYDVNTKLINAFCKNSRYTLRYSGMMYDDCDLKSYCEKRGIENVSFTGAYNNQDKAKLYQGVSLINAMYSTASSDTLRALPNKLYDAAIFRIPILASKGTYLAEVVEHYGLGCAVDTRGEPSIIAEDVEDFVRNFNCSKFKENCAEFLRDVESDQRVFNEIIKCFVTLQ